MLTTVSLFVLPAAVGFSLGGPAAAPRSVARAARSAAPVQMGYNLDLSGKVAFVAGVADSTGYGWAIAKALAAIFIQNLRRRRQRRQEVDSDSESDEEDEARTGFQVIDVGARFDPRHHYNTRTRLKNSLRRSLRSVSERLGVEPLELGFAKED